MVQYFSISNATLLDTLNELENKKVGVGQVIQIFHDGTNYIAVFATN